MTQVIDLSHPVRGGMPVYPGDCETAVQRVADVAVSGYNLTKITMSAHAGTHLDAPYHFVADGATVDQIPLDVLVGPAEVLNLGELPPGADITVAALNQFSDRVSEGTRVLIRTGWSRRFGSPEFFTAHPCLTHDAARWLVSRGIVLLGIEEPSLHTRENAAIHRIILGAGIPLIENLANLDRIPGDRAFLVVLPLNLEGCDGAPVRAAAIVGMAC